MATPREPSGAPFATWNTYTQPGPVPAPFLPKLCPCLCLLPNPTIYPAEEVLLDENKEAKPHKFYMTAGFTESPDHRCAAGQAAAWQAVVQPGKVLRGKPLCSWL